MNENDRKHWLLCFPVDYVIIDHIRTYCRLCPDGGASLTPNGRAISVEQ